MRMDGLRGWQKELPMLTLNKPEDRKQWMIGCDRDIGGFSSAALEITPQGTGRFYGNLSTQLPADREIVQSGYAAIRSKVRHRCARLYTETIVCNMTAYSIGTGSVNVRHTVLGHILVSIFGIASARRQSKILCQLENRQLYTHWSLSTSIIFANSRTVGDSYGKSGWGDAFEETIQLLVIDTIPKLRLNQQRHDSRRSIGNVQRED